MQNFLIALGIIVLFLLILLLLTGGTVQGLVGFFVEELDENNTPVHPVSLLGGIKLFQRDPSKTKTDEVTEEPPKSAPTAGTPRKSIAPAPETEPVPLKATGKASPKEPAKRGSKQGSKRNPNQPYTEMAILTHKIDERRRVVDSNGHSTLYDEYFELVFETRRGETLRLVATRAAFKEIPFNQDGALTYKRGRMLKFKYSGGTVNGEIAPSSAK